MILAYFSKSFAQWCALPIAYFFSAACLAASPTLQVLCSDSDVGAEVFVNGKFRGECPVDLKVSAGTVKLTAKKVHRDGRERIFEQDIRLVDDSTKRVQIILLEANPAPPTRAALQSSPSSAGVNKAAEDIVASDRASIKTDSKFAKTQRAAQGGDSLSMLALGLLYENGSGTPKDTVQALAWYQKAASTGNADALYFLSDTYLRGIGVNMNIPESDALLKRAVAAGSVDALSNLELGHRTRLHNMGLDAPGVAAKLLQAAEAGNEYAMVWLRYYYEYWAKTSNPSEAKKWQLRAIEGLTRRAESGDPRSMEASGTLHRELDRSTATRWFNRALERYQAQAESGDVRSMLALGRFYFEATPGTPEYLPERALYWHRKAAEAGAITAITNVGFSYDIGRGIAKNEDQAIAWYALASVRGDPLARGWMEKIQTTQRERAQAALAKAERDAAPSMAGQLFQFGAMVAGNYYAGKIAKQPSPNALPLVSMATPSPPRNTLANAPSGARPQVSQSIASAPLAKDEGRVVNQIISGVSLEEHQSRTWCERRVPEFQGEIARGGDKILSIGPCSCRAGGAAVALSKQFTCEFSVSLRLFGGNPAR